MSPTAVTTALTSIEPTEHLVACLDLPRPDGHHAVLHAANVRSRDVAIATLESAFPALPLRRSTQATDATTLVVGPADPTLLANLDGEEILSDLTGRLTLRPGVQLKLVRDRETRDLGDVIAVQPGAFPGGHLRARAGAVAAALDEGFTVVLDGVEMRNPTSMQLASLFERAFGCAININGYVSTRRHTSFGAHWDDQEVVILQLLGRKDWIIESPTALSMHKAAHGDAVSGREVWRGRLDPGDAMYVPRGWGHLVSGIDELTFHYTITIPRLNGLHVLDSILAQAPDPACAPGWPVPITADTDALLGVPDLLAATPPEVDLMVRRAVAQTRFRFARRPIGSLRRQLDAVTTEDLHGVAALCPCPGGWVVLDQERCEADQAEEIDFDDAVVAGMAGCLARIPLEHLDLVAALTDGRVHDLSRIDPTVALDLMRLGLLDVVADPDAWGVTAA